MDDRDAGPPLEARPPSRADLVRICRALNERNARYVLIGGFAVSAHGADRTTKDIDFLVDAARDNVARVKEGLGILEQLVIGAHRPSGLTGIIDGYSPPD